MNDVPLKRIVWIFLFLLISLNCHAEEFESQYELALVPQQSGQYAVKNHDPLHLSTDDSLQFDLNDGNDGIIKHPTDLNVDINKHYFKNYFFDTGKIIREPFRWDSTAKKYFLLETGLALALYSSDEHIATYTQKHRTDSTNNFSSDVRSAADNAIYALGAWYLYGKFGHDTRARSTALLSLEGALISGFFTSTVKIISGRKRPNITSDSSDWRGWGYTDSAFTSGHSSSAWAVASVISHEYHEHRWVPFAAYTSAALVSWSRLNDNKHWASDVFVGGLIGYYTGKLLVRYHHEEYLHETQSSQHSQLELMPFATGDAMGLSLHFSF